MKDNLTDKQIGTLVYSTLVGYGIISLPKDITSYMGTTGWFSVILCGIIIIIFSIIIINIMTTFRGKNFYQISSLLVGEKITTVFCIVYSIYCYIFYVIIPKGYTEIIKVTSYSNTPFWFFEMLIYIVCIYAVIKGIKTIGRLSEIYALITFVGILGIGILVSFEGKIINLFPIFYIKNIGNLIGGMYQSFLPFLGIECLFFMKYDKQNNKSKQYVISIIAIIILLYIFIIEVCISVLGTQEVIRYNNLVLTVLRSISSAYLEVSTRLDGIFLILWTMKIILSCIIFGYGSALFLNLALKKKNSKYKNKIIFILSLIAFLLGFLNVKISKLNSLLSVSTSIFGVFTAVLIPLSLFIIMKVKKYDKKV